MTDLTMSMVILEQATKAKLLSESEFRASLALLRSQERLDKLVKTNKELRGMIENYSNIVFKLNYILEMLDEYRENQRTTDKVVG